jgi:hypothetical protein
VQLRDVHVVRSAGSEVTLRGTLESLSFRRSEGRYAGEQARFQVTGNAGTGGYEVAAPHVTGLPVEQRAEGTGGVTLRTDKGVTGRTASAQLDGKAGVVTGTERLEAQGLVQRLPAQKDRRHVALGLTAKGEEAVAAARAEFAAHDEIVQGRFNPRERAAMADFVHRMHNALDEAEEAPPTMG